MDQSSSAGANGCSMSGLACGHQMIGPGPSARDRRNPPSSTREIPLRREVSYSVVSAEYPSLFLALVFSLSKQCGTNDRVRTFNVGQIHSSSERTGYLECAILVNRSDFVGLVCEQKLVAVTLDSHRVVLVPSINPLTQEF